MQAFYRFWLTPLLFFTFFSSNLQAQEKDSLQKYQDAPNEVKLKEPFYKSKVFKATIVPAVLIGYGVSVIGYNGFYSSQDAKADILEHFPNFHTKVDDPLLIMPYVELVAANLFNQK